MAAKLGRELIQLENIVKRYGEFTALAGVSLTVYEGEFLALLGPSGCGKTTLLRTIAGFADPTEGSLKIDGCSMLNTPPNRRPVNTVFQNYALFPHMTVYDNVAFGPRRHGIKGNEIDIRVREALLLVSMDGFEARYPTELSGGQQQRVALARAVINRPKVLLLDEPLAALDLKLRKRMQMELKHLQEKLGITFIIVTHDQEEALVMADRIAVMSKGHIEQVGSGTDIYTNPNSRFVADFIGEANLIDCYVGEDGQLRVTRSDLSLPYQLDSRSVKKATLMLRPECLTMRTEELAPDHISIRAVVREVVHAGASTRIYLESEISDDIVMQVNSTHNLQRISHGEKVDVCWREQDARILTC